MPLFAETEHKQQAMDHLRLRHRIVLPHDDPRRDEFFRLVRTGAITEELTALRLTNSDVRPWDKETIKILAEQSFVSMIEWAHANVDGFGNIELLQLFLALCEQKPPQSLAVARCIKRLLTIALPLPVAFRALTWEHPDTSFIFPAHWDPKLRIPRGQVVAAASIVSPKY